MYSSETSSEELSIGSSLSFMLLGHRKGTPPVEKVPYQSDHHAEVGITYSFLGLGIALAYKVLRGFLFPKQMTKRQYPLVPVWYPLTFPVSRVGFISSKGPNRLNFANNNTMSALLHVPSSQVESQIAQLPLRTVACRFLV